MPHDLRDLARRRRVAAALGSHDAVDDGHADAGKVTEPDAFQDVLAWQMLRLVHDDEIGGAADLDQAAIEFAHPRGVAGGEAEGEFGRHFAERNGWYPVHSALHLFLFDTNGEPLQSAFQ
jgi:hypothetical protein